MAIEADPSLVAYCERRFADAIDDGRLRIVAAQSPARLSDVSFYLILEVRS